MSKERRGWLTEAERDMLQRDGIHQSGFIKAAAAALTDARQIISLLDITRVVHANQYGSPGFQRFVRPNKCTSWRSWLLASWDFLPSSLEGGWPSNKREWGVRLFGIELTNRRLEEK